MVGEAIKNKADLDNAYHILRRFLYETQANLFVMSGSLGNDSAVFIKAFMNSAIAKGLDSSFDFMYWCGKEHMLERMQDELPEAFVKVERFQISLLLLNGR